MAYFWCTLDQAVTCNTNNSLKSMEIFNFIQLSRINHVIKKVE
jgi:hypothetical protein